MNNEQTNQVAAELENATTLSPVALLLEQLRITADKQLPKMDFLFRLFGRPCLPRRELVAVTGKAKSGKTFVTSMLIACCVIRDVLSFHRSCDNPLRVLWYDTEKNLVRWLSETTNMGSYESVRQLYYRCQREYVRK